MGSAARIETLLLRIAPRCLCSFSNRETGAGRRAVPDKFWHLATVHSHRINHQTELTVAALCSSCRVGERGQKTVNSAVPRRPIHHITVRPPMHHASPLATACPQHRVVVVAWPGPAGPAVASHHRRCREARREEVPLIDLCLSAF